MIQIEKEGHLCEAACTPRKPLHGPSFSFMDVAVVHLSKFIWKQHFGLYVTCKGVRKHMLHKYHPNFDTQVVDPIQSCSKTYNYRVQSFFGQRFSSQVLGMTRLHFRLRITHHVSSHRCHLLYTGYIVIVGRRVKQIEMRNV